MTTVHVHIDRLVLTGLPLDRRAGPAVEAAVAAELSRLFAAGEVPYAATVPVLRGDALPAAVVRSPAAVGTAVARSLHGGIRS